MALNEIVCMHKWREWSTYQDATTLKDFNDGKFKEGRSRSCIRCNVIQRNDDPEPRVVMARIE